MSKKYSIILLIVFSAGITKAADSTWTDLPVQWPTSLAKDTNGVIYTTGGWGIFKSTDSGDSWIQMTTDAAYHAGFAVTVNPVTNDVFIAVEPGVYRSTDGGVMWTKLTNDIVGTYALGARGDGTLIAAGSPGTWRSTDNGDNWTKVHNNLGGLNNGIAFSSSGTIFMTTLLDGLYKSTDDGDNWTHIANVFGDTANVMDVVCDTVNDVVYATAFHQFFQQPTYNRVYRSFDDGLNWELIDSVSGISLSLGIDNAGNLFSSRQPTTYSSDFGMSWNDVPSGINQGDRLMDYIEAAPGKILLADRDDNLKVAFIGMVPSCCVGMRGDVDDNGMDDIGDLVYFVDYSFGVPSGPEPVCFEEADVDGSAVLDITDIVYLVSFMFSTGPAPLVCP